MRLVAASISRGTHDIARLVSEVPEAIAQIHSREGVLTTLAGGALLHAFYNELEKLFELVASHLEGFETSGEDWHRRLAEQMLLEVPRVRPALMPAALREPLQAYRSFRHLFRHLYALDLNSKRVSSLLEQLEHYWKVIRISFQKFEQAMLAIATEMEKD